MGMLDGLLGSVVGGMMNGGSTSANAGPNPLMQLALQILQQNGGLEGLLGKLQQAGYGEQAQSWVGTGENQPITPDVLSQIFGQGQLGNLAQQYGMSQQDALGGLAQMLPSVVDQMTPQGQIPDNQSDIVAEALAMLQRQRPG